MGKYNQQIEYLRKNADFSYPLSMDDAEKLKQLIESNINVAPALADLFINDDTIKTTRTKNFAETIERATLPFEDNQITETQQGIYVFIYQNEVVYLGITRQFYSRLRAHCFSKVRSSSNLATLLAKNNQNEKVKPSEDQLRNAASFIRNNFKFLFIPIKQYTKKYWLEVTLAHHFKAPLNSFKTH